MSSPPKIQLEVCVHQELMAMEEQGEALQVNVSGLGV